MRALRRAVGIVLLIGWCAAVALSLQWVWDTALPVANRHIRHAGVFVVGILIMFIVLFPMGFLLKWALAKVDPSLKV